MPPGATRHTTCIFCQLRPLSRWRTLTGGQSQHQWPPAPPRRKYTRPSVAPKPTPDIRHIAQNPGLYEQNCIDRNYGKQSQNGWQILKLRQRRAELQKQARETREANNKLQEQFRRSQQPGGDKTNETPSQELLNKGRVFKDELAKFVEEEKKIEDEIIDLALALPNLSGLHTPPGSEPVVVRTYEAVNSKSKSETSTKSHSDIGALLDLIDFSGSATSSGWGWYFLKNEAALLEQALVQYALSVVLKRGYKVVAPPSVVYSHIAAACGFQPRDQNGEQQIYSLVQTDKDKESKPALSLAATAEIPLAAMKSGVTLSEEELPLKVAAASRCYRAEAGARGVDTKGLYRVHEFTKVEMFAWTAPDAPSSEDQPMGFFDTDAKTQSLPIFDEMVSVQEEILQSLGLSYRVLEMPAEELGATASRKQDIEVLFPSRLSKDQGWGEVTSTSICTDYQTRRLATRLRLRDGRLDWPYTLNGTALAVPRVLAALLEYGYEGTSGKDSGTVRIPECLRPWMGGAERIG